MHSDAFCKLLRQRCPPTKVSVDASAYGLEQFCRPVAFASSSLSETKSWFSQIKRGLTWALEKFSEYVIGKTGNRPQTACTVPLLGNKSLDMSIKI